eukprot:gene11948-25031_t
MGTAASVVGDSAENEGTATASPLIEANPHPVDNTYDWTTLGTNAVSTLMETGTDQYKQAEAAIAGTGLDSYASTAADLYTAGIAILSMAVDETG